MKVLITGGTGFIGTNFIKPLLKERHQVYLIDNLSHSKYLPDTLHKGAFFEKIDIRDREKTISYITRIKPDIIFHFAGLVSIYDCNKNPYLAVTNNILGSINVFDAALQANSPRVIFSETSAVYEESLLNTYGYVELQSNPRTIYASSKASVATLAKSYSKTKGLLYTALRYFNVTGAVQDYKRTVPPLFAGIALRLIGGNNPIIFGDGTRRRDFIHVDDVNSFHLKLIQEKDRITFWNETFNIGTGTHKSLFEISEMVKEKLKTGPYKDFIPDKINYDFYPEINGEAHTIFANIYKAKMEGWKPEKSIDDMINDTVDYLYQEIEKGNVDPKTFMENLNLQSIKI